MKIKQKNGTKHMLKATVDRRAVNVHEEMYKMQQWIEQEFEKTYNLAPAKDHMFKRPEFRIFFYNKMKEWCRNNV
jgi:hypothetical protein